MLFKLREIVQVVRALVVRLEVGGSSPSFPAFDKWSKPRLKKELRKLDSKFSKHSKYYQLRYALNWAWDSKNKDIQKLVVIDLRRKKVRLELKRRWK